MRGLAMISQARHTPHSANVNYVFSHARGEYYMWHSADDWWREGFFERATAILDRDPGVVMVFSHFQVYDWTTREFRARGYWVASHGTPRLRLLTPASIANTTVPVMMFHDVHAAASADQRVGPTLGEAKK